MRECSKSIQRRMHNPDFINRFFVGDGVDIGGKPDPLSLYRSMFCQMKSVRVWDIADGDAQHMAGVADQSFDFVHSSHCLEHLHDPKQALDNWLRIIRPGGHVVVTVPDEDLYEQGSFPSTFNADHKWTFTSFKPRSWSPRSVNVVDLVRTLGPESELVRLELLSSTYRFELPRYDQTLTPVGEAAIEFVLRRRTEAEITHHGRHLRPTDPPHPDIHPYLAEYLHDAIAINRQRVEDSKRNHPVISLGGSK